MKNKKTLIIFFMVVFICTIIGFYVSKSVATYMLLKENGLGFSKSGVVNATKVEIVEGSGKTLHINNIKAYGNSDVAKLKLNAKVYPANATNKKVTWSSSNKELATVDKNGLVTINKKLGTVKITASLNGVKDTYELVLKEKTIVVVTASLGTRMRNYFKEYTYKDKFEFVNKNTSKSTGMCISDYKSDPGNLIYVCNPGSGSDYQYGEGTYTSGSDEGEYKGLTATKEVLNNKYKKDQRKYVDLTVFYTLSGNKVKNYSCDEINTGKNDLHKGYADGYKKAIKILKGEGYKNIKGIVMSHAPLNTIDMIENHDSNFVYYSQDKRACEAKVYDEVAQGKGNYIKLNNGTYKKVPEGEGNYRYEGVRSAYKYHLSNMKMKSVIENGDYSELSFLNAFENIVKINKASENKKKGTAKFDWVVLDKDLKLEYNRYKDGLLKVIEYKKGTSYRKIYKTSDGLHWDEPTTKIYMKLAFDQAELQ